MTAAPVLVACTFLGRNVGGGVTAPFRDVLAKVETALRTEHAGIVSAPPFVEWAGVYGVGGYRAPPSGLHGHGVAVDLNYSTCGYFATRTYDALGRPQYGGEAAGSHLSVRKPFVDACDRACVEVFGDVADLSARKHGESTAAAWDRLHRVSEAVRAYLAPYFPAHDALDVGEADILPGVTVPPQVLADYEALRVPLVIGAPSVRPRTMRNPARGLFDIPRAVAVALCDVGHLRWGAIDFGPLESGDGMHFDAPRLA